MYVLIDNYDSFTYNLYHYLLELGVDVSVFRNDAITVKEIKELGPKGIIISPGPSTPDDAGICLELIEDLKGKIPIFGVCLGHQSIGQVYGGDVVRAGYVMHGKVSDIHHNSQGVFKGLPNPFKATRYHSLVVDIDSFPDSLCNDAQTADGLIMGLSDPQHSVYGVQFHPESIASEHGHKILQNFIEIAESFKVDE